MIKTNKMIYLVMLSLSLLYNTNVSALIDWKFGSESSIIFHAYVVEKSQEILVHPPLDVRLSRGSQLCHLYLLPTENNQVPNFVSPVVLDSQQGIGGLRLNETLLYSSRKRESEKHSAAIQGMGVYHLKIFAEDCSWPAHSTRPWTMNLVLIPTEQPVWSVSHYDFRISSNHQPGSLVGKVTAYAVLGLNENPGHRLGDDTGMCSYAIDDPGHSHFDVDSHGAIRSRVRFEQWTNLDFHFNVTGFDCASPVPNRATVMVNIHVQPGCVAGWRNIPEILDYRLLSKSKPIMPLADLEVCQIEVTALTNGCDLEKATLRSKLLWTRDDPQANGLVDSDDEAPYLSCDLDELALDHQRATCGLPSGHSTKLLHPVGSRMANSAIHLFDGSNQVSNELGDQPGAMREHRMDNANFTLTFWMKHEFRPGNADDTSEGSGKETIVCTSDSQGKNRHHFTVFLRNCKLTVLLRQEPRQESLLAGSKVKPLYFSQWRFGVDEVCDSTWHHYTILHLADIAGSTSPNQVQLYIDGSSVPRDDNSVQVSEDYALGATIFDRDGLQPTKLTVGACWHSRQSQYENHFHGALAGLTLSRNVTLTPVQIGCLSSCLPELRLAGELEAGTSQSESSKQVVIESDRLKDLVELAREIDFYSPRLRYYPHRRPEVYAIHINTKLKFKSDCRNVSIPDYRIHVNRLPPEHQTGSKMTHKESPLRASLHLSNPELAATAEPTEVPLMALIEGVKLFPSTELQWKPNNVLGDNKVEYCQVGLCQAPGLASDQPIEFQEGESIVLNPTAMTDINYVIITTRDSRVTLTGPSDVGPMKMAINNLQWFYRPRSTSAHPPPASRCFQLVCVPQGPVDFNVNDPRDGKSIPLQVMFTIRGMGKSTTTTVIQVSPKPAVEMEVPAHLTPDTNVEGQAVLWEHRSPVSYLLLGVMLTILIASLAIAVVYACRSRYQLPVADKMKTQGHVDRQSALANLKRKLPPPGRLSSGKCHEITGRNENNSEFSRLFMTLNPMDVSQQAAVRELEKKRCVYRPEYYDDYTTPLMDVEELQQVE